MAPQLTPIAEAAHAFLAPSSAGRWVLCSGSAWMESQYPDLTPAEEREAGTAAHWVLEWSLTAGTLPAVGTRAPNGVEVTQEMRDGAELATRTVEASLLPVYGDSWRQAVMVERRVQIPRVHPTHNWGTPDIRAWARLPGRFILWLFDYKFGMDPVEVFENWQLVDYFAGCLDEGKALFGADWDESLLDVHFCVLQPRAYHGEGPVRWWRTEAPKLSGLVHRLSFAADEATGEHPQLRPSPEACTYCRARWGCDALSKASWRGVEIAKQAVPRDLSDANAGLALAMMQDYAKLMKAHITGLEELIKSRIQRGATIPHFAFTPGDARLKWHKPVGEVLAMGQMMGFDLAKPTEPITPLQAIERGMPADMVEGPYAKREAGAVKLTRVTDAATRKIFG